MEPGNAPLFALFAEPTAATAALLQRFEGLLDRELRPPFRADALWLVRPDGYVACAADDATVVADYLRGLTGTGGRGSA